MQLVGHYSTGRLHIKWQILETMVLPGRKDRDQNMADIMIKMLSPSARASACPWLPAHILIQGTITNISCSHTQQVCLIEMTSAGTAEYRDASLHSLSHCACPPLFQLWHDYEQVILRITLVLAASSGKRVQRTPHSLVVTIESCYEKVSGYSLLLAIEHARIFLKPRSIIFILAFIRQKIS